MANSIESFDLTAASEFMFDILRLKIVDLMSFTTDVSTGNVSAAELRKGKTVHVRLFNAPPVSGAGVGDFNKSTNNYQDAYDENIDTVAVAIDQHKKVTATLDDAELELWRDGLPVQLLSNIAYTLSRIVSTEVQSNLTTANFSAETIVAATALDFDEIANQRKIMFDAGADMNNLYCVLDSAYYLNLIQDDPTQTLLSRQTDELLREANVGKIHGVNIVESAEVNNVSENLAGWISDKTGMALAGAVLVPGRGANVSDEVIDWATSTDPLTGLTMGLRKHYAAETGDTYITAEMVFGSAVARTSGISRLVTAA